MIMLGCWFMLPPEKPARPGENRESGEEALRDSVPFREVYIHALVRDADRQKMSKTRGNVIDPLNVTEKYGTDAVRMALLQGAAPGTDIVLTEERMESSRAFANKIWNAARFVLMNAEGWDPHARPTSVYDKWIVSRFQRCADQTRTALEEFRLSDAANGIYRFIWNELCDWAIELEKPALQGQTGGRAGAQAALLTALEGALRLLHPFMPFVTEEIWQKLPNKQGPSIMVAEFPKHRPELLDAEAEKEMDAIARAIDGARSVRGEVNLPPNQKVPLQLFARVPALFKKHERAFMHLANASEVQIHDLKAPRPHGAAVHVEAEVEVHLPLKGLIDFAAEKARVDKELQAAAAELEKIRSRLDNAGFVARAPKEVVDKDRARAEELQGKREKLARHLARVEAGMQEDKNGQQGNRSLDQMGTHGGPAAGAPPQQPAPQAAEHKEQGAPNPAAAPPSGEPGFAAKAVATVKSIAHDLMEKLPGHEEHQGPGGEQPAKQEKPAPRPAAKKRKAKPAAKAGKKKAAKAARAAPKAKKAPRGKPRAAARRAAKGKGRSAQKRGKSSARRPAKRKGKK